MDVFDEIGAWKFDISVLELAVGPFLELGLICGIYDLQKNKHMMGCY